METSSALLAICAGNSPAPGKSSHKGQWRGALMFSLICVWIKGWVNNREDGDLRRYSAHYDVTFMCVAIVVALADYPYFHATCTWNVINLPFAQTLQITRREAKDRFVFLFTLSWQAELRYVSGVSSRSNSKVNECLFTSPEQHF